VTEQTADRHLFNANLNFSYPLHLQK